MYWIRGFRIIFFTILGKKEYREEKQNLSLSVLPILFLSLNIRDFFRSVDQYLQFDEPLFICGQYNQREKEIGTHRSSPRIVRVRIFWVQQTVPLCWNQMPLAQINVRDSKLDTACSAMLLRTTREKKTLPMSGCVPSSRVSCAEIVSTDPKKSAGWKNGNSGPFQAKKLIANLSFELTQNDPIKHSIHTLLLLLCALFPK